MNKFFTALIAGAFAFAAASAMADDKTPSTTSAADQAKLKSEAAMKKADNAKLTKEEKAAAKKARNAKKQAELKNVEKIGDTGSQVKPAEDAKATAQSKMDPKAPKGTLNTPAANKALQKEKGQ